ncbi:hypothetical protein CCR95_14965 [Thiocystis minor]|uniref:3-deoxy-D-manno-octulosonic acid transferase n=1 Tax=Thiocystis minor TaxID=61597 RepID=UPI0019114DFC|nr:glycosyltransferase N-terminal domain-containing protein [Thiocystis minor]MBK5965351.1 hypothetical protein [Thiocystis minor]
MSRRADGGQDAWGRWSLQLYSVVLSLVVNCLLRPRHWLRQLLGHEDRTILRQLLGEPDRESTWSPQLVIHAVSAGEMAASGTIARQLQALRPELRLLLTTSTTSGLEIGHRLQAELDCIGGVTLLPWDRSTAMSRWLKHWSPRALVVVETELWPNLFDTCRNLGIALAVVSARLYPGDVWKYRLIRGFMTQVLACPAWIGAQDETERRGFMSIGASPGRIRVLGNAKYVFPPPTPLEPYHVHDADGVPARLLVAGSTHAPEERWLLDVLSELRGAFPRLRLVLAPRHVERAAGLARTVARRGWHPCRLSGDDWRDQDWDVLILDRMGHLTPFYSRADVVVMGGSLTNRGGHNFLEAAWLARPILVGAHLRHFASVAQRFLARDALCLVRNRTELAARLAELLGSPARATDLGRRARLCAEREGERASGYGQAVVELIDQGG